jgi:hypothetical protein
MYRLYALALAGLLGLSSSACNVFEGLAGESPLSNNVEVLLTDGQRAIARGDAREAVRIFSHAVSVTRPETYEGRISRIKLATARLQEKRISVLELQEVAAGIVESLDRLPAAPRTDLNLGAVCSFEAPDTAYDLLDLEAIRGYATLRAHTATLADVRVLIQQALVGIGPVASRAQIQAGLNSLRAEGAEDLVLAEALANGALANIGVAYDAIVTAGDAGNIQWVKVKPPSGDVYLGYCASSQAALNALRTQTSAQIRVIETAVEMVDLRASSLPLFSGDTVSKALVRDARAALERLVQELGAAFPG